MKTLEVHNVGSKTAGHSGRAVQQAVLLKVVRELGGGYSAALDIDLDSAKSGEIFKWLLASVLFGARINEGIAMKTYKEFEKASVLSPEAIWETGWQGLVDILDRGGYVRYDFKTATKLLDIAETLVQKYGGDLNRLHFFAQDDRDLEAKLQNLAGGIGPTTVNIFLRELRDIWEKAESPFSESAFLASKNLGVTQATEARVALEELKAICGAQEEDEVKLYMLESALVKLDKNYCRKNKCPLCPVREECQLGMGQRGMGETVVTKG